MRALKCLGLFHKPNERSAGTGIQFLCIQSPIVIWIGGAETLLDNGKVLVLRDSAVFVRIGRSQLLSRQASCQFFLVQRAVLVALQSVKERGRRFFASARSTVPSLSVSSILIKLALFDFAVAGNPPMRKTPAANARIAVRES